MAEIHNCCLTRSNAGILESAKYSDLTVRCGSQEFKLHRAIVCPRSTFFAAACDGQFQEAQTSTIVLEEDDPPTVHRMLTYIYTLAYDDEGDAASPEHYMANGTKMSNSMSNSQAATTTSTPLSAEELSRHAKMMNNVVVCAIAQKYDIRVLKELATLKFLELLWLNAPSHGTPDVVHAVFETTSITDSGRRSVATKYCTFYSTEIIADDHLSSMFNDHSELGLDVLREVDGEAIKKQGQLVTLERELTDIWDSASRRGFHGQHTLVEVEVLARLLKMAHDSISNMK